MPDALNDSVLNLLIQVAVRRIVGRHLYQLARFPFDSGSICKVGIHELGDSGFGILRPDLKDRCQTTKRVQYVLVEVTSRYVIDQPVYATRMARSVRLIRKEAVAAVHSANRDYLGTLSRQQNHVAVLNLIGETPELGGGFRYLPVARIPVAWLTAQMVQEIIPDGKVFDAPPKVEVDRNNAFPKNKVLEFTQLRQL